MIDASSRLGSLERYAITPFVRRDAWLILFAALIVFQSGHVLEHVAQMVQIHILQIARPQAHGIVGMLNIEWVHFAWNMGVLAAVVVLLVHFSRSPWLWLAAAFAGWHMLEHVVIIVGYIQTMKEGGPGLLSSGGLIAGGLPLKRPELHFLYNLIETIPLYVAFASEVRRTLSGGGQVVR